MEEINQKQAKKAALRAKTLSSMTSLGSKQRAKSGSSKISSILGNLERSIISQFSASAYVSSSSTSPTSALSNTSAKTKIAKKFNPLQTISLNPQHTSNNRLFATGATRQYQAKNKDQHHCEQKRQLWSTQDESRNKTEQTNNNSKYEIKLPNTNTKQLNSIVQDTSRNGFCKATLNKCQQRIVSTMRPNQSTAKSNKLSIPPPHANDELRNQNQRLIFGEANLSSNPADSVLPDTSSLGSKGCATLKRDAKKNEIIKIDDASPHCIRALAKAETCANLCAISPTKTEKSLPITQKNTINSSSQPRFTADEEDESGFSLYRSRILSMSNAQSTTNSADHEPKSRMISAYGSSFQLSPSDNNSYNKLGPPLMYRYPSGHPQQPHTMIRNQPNFGSQQLSMTEPSTRFAGSMMYPEQLFNNQPMYNQMHQLAHQSYINDGAIADSSQEIYANAPPKPRRYQYYNQHPLQNQQIVTSRVPTAFTSAVTPSESSQFSSLQFNQPSPRQQLNRNHQTVLNYSYPVPISRQPVSALNGHSQYTTQNNYTNQIKPNNMPRPLIRSKSSLAAEDLIFRNNARNLHHYQPASQYPIYETKYQKSNRYSANINSTNYHQQTQQLIQRANLQRSKSVTHLASDYEMPTFGQDAAQPNSIRDAMKFLSTSASSTNLNSTGLTPSTQRIFIQCNNDQVLKPLGGSQLQLTNASSDMFENQNNLLASHKEQSSSNFSRNEHIKTSLNGKSPWTNSSTQSSTTHHFRDHHETTSKQHHHQTLPRDKSLLDNLSKLSLDDKIRCLMIGNDRSNFIVVKQQPDDSATTPRQSYISNTGVSSLDNSTKDPTFSQAKLSQPGDKKYLKTNNNGTQIGGAYQNSNLFDTFALANAETISDQRIYMNEFKFNTMGNRQCQYRPYPMDYNFLRNGSPSSQQSSEDPRYKGSINSQLIVDLTTPRVLAKTQTTLSSKNLSDISTGNDSCSINQVGLPQLTANRSSSSTVSSSTIASSIRLDETHANSRLEEKSGSEIMLSQNNERAAPYYYSDLKSEEQRKAFLNIMHQKSLSPPPQLLSRSIDHSSTRLAPMSVKVPIPHILL